VLLDEVVRDAVLTCRAERRWAPHGLDGVSAIKDVSEDIADDAAQGRVNHPKSFCLVLDVLLDGVFFARNPNRRQSAVCREVAEPLTRSLAVVVSDFVRQRVSSTVVDDVFTHPNDAGTLYAKGRPGVVLFTRRFRP
tara:strand:+ start:332 stop:742 length:411 start_codon:yes stop_codon:yes gene_type:complete